MIGVNSMIMQCAKIRYKIRNKRFHSSIVYSCSYVYLKQNKKLLPGRESNPGLPRDRRRYLPLYYRGLLASLILHRRDLVCGEESAVVAGEVVEGLVDLAFTVWQDHYLEEQAFPHTIQATKSSLLQIIEVHRI